MSLTEKDLLKKLLTKKELDIIESLCKSDDPEHQIDTLME